MKEGFRTTVRLPGSLEAQIKDYANLSHISMNEACVRLIEKGLDLHRAGITMTGFGAELDGYLARHFVQFEASITELAEQVCYQIDESLDGFRCAVLAREARDGGEPRDVASPYGADEEGIMAIQAVLGTGGGAWTPPDRARGGRYDPRAAGRR